MTPTTEIWRPIVGWEGYYEVSDLSRIRSVHRWVDCSDGRRRLYRGQLLACTVGSRGRRMAHLRQQERTAYRPVALFVLEAFRGPRPLGFHGCHNNGDCLDDRLANLRWDSVDENMRDQVRHGTHAMAKRTHCPLEHLLAEPNLVASMRPYRKCKACHRAQATMSNARRAGRTAGDRRSIADGHYADIMGVRCAS